MNASMNVTTTMEDRLYIEALQAIQKQLTYTAMAFTLLIGNIGCVFNAIIFVRPKLISSSCSRYFLASSFANAFQLNIGLVSTILDYGFSIHPYHSSSILCKLRNYLINTGGFLSQTYLLLACVDRYLISTNKSRYRRMSTVRMTNRLIFWLSLFWILFLSHMLIYSDVSWEANFCFFSDPIYVVFISLHNLVLSGFVLPLLMVIFGLLTLRNIKRIRRQVSLRRRKRRNHYLSLMLVSNVFVSVIFTCFYTGGLIYLSLFMSNKSTAPSTRTKVEQRFIAAVAITFYYIPFAVSFYVNIFTSRRFRSELRKILCSQRRKSRFNARSL